MNRFGSLRRPGLPGLFALLLLAARVCGADLPASGIEWLHRIDEAERVPHSYGEIVQTITTSSGSERALRARMWTGENGDVSLTVYTDPPRVRGDKILTREEGDQIWYYMRRRDVTRHFVGTARRQEAMGSDFAYQDFAYGDLAGKYTAEALAFEEVNGEKCVKLRCVPTERGPTYEHIVLWASAEDHLTRRIEYHDDDGLLKTLTATDFRVVEGRRSAFHLEMVNAREGSRTVIAIRTVTYATEPDPSLFTLRALAAEEVEP